MADKGSIRLVIESFLSVRIFVAFIAATVMALVITLSVALSLGVVDWVKDERLPRITGYHVGLTILFLIALAGLTLVIYVRSYRENDDLFTPFRKQLCGDWQMKYTTWLYTNGGQVVFREQSTNCTIGIDEVTAKLFIHVNPQETEMAQSSPSRITDVLVNPLLDQKRVTYYYEARMQLKPSFTFKYQLPGGDLVIPVLGVLTAHTGKEGKNVISMKGKWYDLDGTYSDFIEKLARIDKIDVQTKLPRMGTLEFARAND